MLNTLLLQAPAAAPGMGLTPIFMVAMLAVFYFFLIRPQSKKAKEQKAFLENIKKGDKIVTLAGIHGKIVQMEETSSTMLVEVAENVKIRMDKAAISMEYTKLAYQDPK